MFREANVEIRMTTKQLLALYHDYYDQKLAFHYIAEKDDKLIAMAGGFLKNDFPFCLYPNPVYGFIGDVFVNSKYRKQGLAKELSSLVIAELKNSGVSEIRLLATKSAKGVYERLGFSDAYMMVKHV